MKRVLARQRLLVWAKVKLQEIASVGRGMVVHRRHCTKPRTILAAAGSYTSLLICIEERYVLVML
jgi:hypothetical protein